MSLPISALLIASFWLAWPWLAPQLLHLALSSGTAHLLVVLDGTPRWPVPAQGMPELLQSFDAVTQITALAQWLQQQHPLPKRVWIATTQITPPAPCSTPKSPSAPAASKWVRHHHQPAPPNAANCSAMPSASSSGAPPAAPAPGWPLN